MRREIDREIFRRWEIRENIKTDRLAMRHQFLENIAYINSQPDFYYIVNKEIIVVD